MMFNLVKLPGFKRNPLQIRGSLKVQFTLFLRCTNSFSIGLTPPLSLVHTCSYARSQISAKIIAFFEVANLRDIAKTLRRT